MPETSSPSDAEFVEAVHFFPNEMPCCLVTNHDSLETICEGLNCDPPRVRTEGWIGDILGIPIWIDERFEHPILIGGND